jgi:hypothetical protein
MFLTASRLCCRSRALSPIQHAPRTSCGGFGPFHSGQVKHHKSGRASGREDVDRLLSLKNGIFRLGLLITNTSFTRDARWSATLGDNRFFVRLRDFEDLQRWLEEDFREFPVSVRDAKEPVLLSSVRRREAPDRESEKHTGDS